MNTQIPTGCFFALMLAMLASTGGCSEEPRPPAVTAGDRAPAGAGTPMVQKGMYFKPDLTDFAMHNEYDADGNGDGVKETHVRRYINQQGDTAFSMTTGERLWAWSLDVRNNDDDIRKNFVIRDSNCDGVFDERYTLSAEFHVPDCLIGEGGAKLPGSV